MKFTIMKVLEYKSVVLKFVEVLRPGYEPDYEWFYG